jgi:hypothetical protein
MQILALKHIFALYMQIGRTPRISKYFHRICQTPLWDRLPIRKPPSWTPLDTVPPSTRATI